MNHKLVILGAAITATTALIAIAFVLRSETRPPLDSSGDASLGPSAKFTPADAISRSTDIVDGPLAASPTAAALDFASRARDVQAMKNSEKLTVGGRLLMQHGHVNKKSAAELAAHLLSWTLLGSPDDNGENSGDEFEFTEAEFRAAVDSFSVWAALDPLRAGEWIDSAQDDYALAILREFTKGNEQNPGSPSMAAFLESLAAARDSDLLTFATGVYAEEVLRNTDPANAFAHLQSLSYVNGRLARSLVTTASLRPSGLIAP